MTRTFEFNRGLGMDRKFKVGSMGLIDNCLTGMFPVQWDHMLSVQPDGHNNSCAFQISDRKITGSVGSHVFLIYAAVWWCWQDLLCALTQMNSLMKQEIERSFRYMSVCIFVLFCSIPETWKTIHRTKAVFLHCCMRPWCQDWGFVRENE